jgi:hypothetical protein
VLLKSDDHVFLEVVDVREDQPASLLTTGPLQFARARDLG